MIHLSDCRDFLPTVPTGSVKAVITDPPYPGIDRDYGRWSEESWFDLMNQIMPEIQRVLSLPLAAA